MMLPQRSKSDTSTAGVLYQCNVTKVNPCSSVRDDAKRRYVKGSKRRENVRRSFSTSMDGAADESNLHVPSICPIPRILHGRAFVKSIGLNVIVRHAKALASALLLLVTHQIVQIPLRLAWSVRRDGHFVVSTFTLDGLIALWLFGSVESEREVLEGRKSLRGPIFGISIV